MAAPKEPARPEWPFKTPYEDAHWIHHHNIRRLETHWRMTGADTSEAWIEAVAMDPAPTPIHEVARRRIAFQYREVELNAFIEGSLVWLAPPVKDRLNEIEAFERIHSNERREYERLKVKFGDT